MWQDYYARHRDGRVDVLSVAVDVQGAEKARPYVERASATFTTVVDEENLLSRLFGFKAIPNGLLVDEEGILRYKKFGGFDIRKAWTAELLERWALGTSWEDPTGIVEGVAVGTDHSRAMGHFREGLDLYRAGRVQEALALWRESVRVDPDNYVIRKQIWAVEHPERFYAGSVDFDWQREQLQQGL